jgi:hypothetical protein
MKKQLLFLSLFTINILIAQVPSYVPTNGLVGYWPFNGNASDLNGNGNNGIVNGANLTTDRFGNANSAYLFNGLNNYIELGNISGLNSTNGISMSAWIQWNGTNGITNHQYIFQIAPNPNGAITITDTSSLVINVLNCNCVNDTQVTTSINQNTWYHVVLTYDLLNGDQKLYLNGILIGTTHENMYSYYTVNNSPSRFGNYYFNSHYFKGSIDEGVLWNRALTQSEITTLYTTLSTEQPLANNQITVYPNPAKEQITIDCGTISNASDWSYKIVNTLGQQVLNGEINSQQNVVLLNSLNVTGVYFVKIYDASNNLLNTKKIVLQ